MKLKLCSAILMAFASFELSAQKLPIDLKDGWEMTWNDEFDYPDKELDKEWISQNSKSGGMVICSRWRENAVVNDGILELIIKKENRGGQEWTAGSIWTKRAFHYGYYECRYKYAGGSGTNNSFWMWPINVPKGEKKFELDVNEGHYPAVINTNIHNWTDKYPNGSHDDWPIAYYMGKEELKPSYVHELKKPIKAQKIRFSSTHPSHFNIGEFSVYEANEAGYPEDPLKYGATKPGLVNLARAKTTKLSASGHRELKGRNTQAKNAINGNGQAWIAQPEGDKWLELDFGSTKEIGCIQLTNGWKHKGNWKGLLHNYKIEYFNGKKWIEIVDFDTFDGVDFSKEYHTYGMLWDEKQIKYYFDGKLIRTFDHTEIISPTRIYLSLALLSNNYAGTITDELDGKSMKVDYVRFYEKK